MRPQLALVVVIALLASVGALEAQQEVRPPSASVPVQPQKPQAPPTLQNEVGASAARPQDEQPARPSEVQQNIFNLRSLFNSTGHRFGAFTDRKCLMCKFSVSLINYALKTKRGYSEVDRLANNFCNIAHLESPLVCSQVSKLFNHEITKVLTYGLVTPNQVCGLLSNNTCGHFHSPLDEWEVQLDASSQLLDKMRHYQQAHELEKRHNSTTTTANGTTTSNRSQETYRVIHISDTHVDLNYLEGSVVKCAEPLCCRRTSSPLNNSQVLGDLTGDELEPSESVAGFWGSYGHCDVPMRTLEATLKFIGSLVDKAKDIDYIIWTGDIQPHDVWAQSKASATRIYDAVFAKIFQHLPNIKILPTLGNHEMIPVDSFSPSNLIDIARDDSPVWLYRKLDSFWSRWLPADTMKTILKDGFYATTIREGLKVISLNTNFCHSKNFWLFINSTDPGNQLQWLVHELQMSELMHEKVHIIGHIPPGSSDCMKVWSKNYNRILRRFQNTITAQFFGHTHTNEFEMFYDQQDQAEAHARSAQATGLEEPNAKTPKQQHQQQVIATISTLNSTLTSTRNLTQAILATAQANANTATASLKPIKVGFIGPSITTFIGLNPSFRIYTVEPKLDFAVTDFETYYMNLTKANTNTTQEPEWTSAGLFTKLMGVNDTSASSMHDLLLEIASDLNLDADEDEEGEVQEGRELDDSHLASTPSPKPPKSTPSWSTTKSSSTTTSTTTTSTTTPKPSTSTTKCDHDPEDEGCFDIIDEIIDCLCDGDEKLFQLYRLYNSYSDLFDKPVYERISADEKRKFLCRLLTGQAHDQNACKEFIPTLEVFSLASANITV